MELKMDLEQSCYVLFRRFQLLPLLAMPQVIESGFRARPCPEVIAQASSVMGAISRGLERFFTIWRDNPSCHVMLWETGGVGIGLIPVRARILNGSFQGWRGALGCQCDLIWLNKTWFPLALRVVDGLVGTGTWFGSVAFLHGLHECFST